MPVRMMCTECRRTAVPATVIEGSDALELVGWLCGLLPGALYCWYRHATRIKACPTCGSRSLIREARAARPLVDPADAFTGQIHYASPPVPLLGRLADPRQRLRRARRAGVLLAAVFGGLAFVAVNRIQVSPDPGPAVIEADESHLHNASVAFQALERRKACDALCRQFHPDNPVKLRSCVRACVERTELTPDRALAIESCADMLDPEACEVMRAGP